MLNKTRKTATSQKKKKYVWHVSYDDGEYTQQLTITARTVKQQKFTAKNINPEKTIVADGVEIRLDSATYIIAINQGIEVAVCA